MCPSIECPSCGKQTYHRGTCENCDFDPLSARWEPPAPLPVEEFLDTVSEATDITAIARETPFPLLRFQSPSFINVDELAEHIGYRGAMFHHKANPEDVFDTEQVGFDLVKDMAKPYLRPFFKAA